MLVLYLLSLILLYPRELTLYTYNILDSTKSSIEGLNIFNTLKISLVDIKNRSTPISNYRNKTKVAKLDLYYRDRHTLKD